MISLTSEWEGERFAGGRPKIPDDLIKRAANIGIEEAWVVLYDAGYKNQFEGDWKMVHDDGPVRLRSIFCAGWMKTRTSCPCPARSW